MKFLCSPKDDIELGFIRSILESENIRYFIQNEHFGNLYIGIQIEALNQKRLYIDDSDYEKAVKLLEGFKISDSTDTSDNKTTFLDKIRLLAEFFLFGWIIPKRRKISKNLKNLEDHEKQEDSD